MFVELFRSALESDPFYADLWLEGEISDISKSSSGHTYFSLRDEDGALKCVLFRNQALRQAHAPKLGDEVIVHGGMSIYPRSGSMQIIVDLLRPAGVGMASLELELMRQRLEVEGLFVAERKRALPAWPRTIGVVTSAFGAAWQDIQQVIGRRFPLAELVLSPAQVQGAGSAESIVAALDALQHHNLDVVIIARGGGASDDLAAFNDERVVRAVFACRVPVIAGIGHATDRTLVEDVADAFAPTPSAAAEICVPSIASVIEALTSLETRLRVTWTETQEVAELSLGRAIEGLIAAGPRLTIDADEHRVKGLTDRASNAVNRQWEDAGRQLGSASALLAVLDPRSVLHRGYAALQLESDGSPIFSVSQARSGSRIRAVLADGEFSVHANDRAASVAEMAGVS
jgi:exodeoxyribonuclease VII large subunit